MGNVLHILHSNQFNPFQQITQNMLIKLSQQAGENGEDRCKNAGNDHCDLRYWKILNSNNRDLKLKGVSEAGKGFRKSSKMFYYLSLSAQQCVNTRSLVLDSCMDEETQIGLKCWSHDTTFTNVTTGNTSKDIFTRLASPSIY